MRRLTAVLAAIALAAGGVMVTASPASAIPADCSLYARISADPGAMYGRAEAYCPNRESFDLKIIVRRMDGWQGNAPVASGYRELIEQGWWWVSATEPCSDVQTNKQYFAHAYLYDTRFVYPILVDEVKSPAIWGHC